MRRRNKAGDRETQALHGIPAPLVRRCIEASEAHRWPLDLKCEVLDTWSSARLRGARGLQICELLSVPGTSVLSRWRRERVAKMAFLERMDALDSEFGRGAA